MARPTKSATGCPYCGGTTSTQVAAPRPDRTVQLCACGSHYVLHAATRVRYPLADPSNPDSPPHS